MTGLQDASASEAPAAEYALRGSTLLLLSAAAAVIFGIQLYLALTRGINWDEFQHYDVVRRLDAGTLNQVLQTFFAQYFTWLLHLPGDVTDHIRVARVIMVFFEMGTAIAIFALARRFASDGAAALVALAYLTAGFVVIHGTAFRTDAQAAFLLMSALWLLASRRPDIVSALVFGALTGLAAMITIKVVIYAPAFAGIAWLRLRESGHRRTMAGYLAGCVIASLAVFAALYVWHSGFITKPALSAGMSTIGSASGVVFSAGLLPRLETLVFQIVFAPHVTALIIVTLVLLPRLPLTRAQSLSVLAMLLPLAVVLIYRNAFAYFYVFLLPPVLVATAPALQQLLMKRRRYGILPLAALFMPAWALFIATLGPSGILDGQKQTIAVAHQLFPEPVTYFDFAGSLGDYDRALNFMPSGWGLASYRAREVPKLSQIMAEKAVPLLIENHHVLEAALVGNDWPEKLLDADAEALHNNFIHHWGRIWVAGKHIDAGAAPVSVNIGIPGQYTLEQSALRIDGTSYQPGEVIDLSRGTHEIGGGRTVEAILRWGDHLEIPAEAPTASPPFQPLKSY